MNYTNNYVAYCCLDMYSIGYQITEHLVFNIMAWNQLVIVSLWKQIMDIIQLFHGYAGNSQIIVPR